ncbi:hypothetical protein A8L34_22440 [Bacillus sp. FJAT-27264]|nr:hypothetical protein A8L34_22440 [Bacillus sp. FJAT-27264]
MRKRDVVEYSCMLSVMLGLVVLIILSIVPVSAGTQALLLYSSLAVAIIMSTHKYRSASKSRQ